jgi:hypothetical protein
MFTDTFFKQVRIPLEGGGLNQDNGLYAGQLEGGPAILYIDAMYSYMRETHSRSCQEESGDNNKTFMQSDRACHAVDTWSGYISSAAFCWDTARAEHIFWIQS